MNKTEKIQELEKLISKMDLPFYRKTIKSGDSLCWLSRNIAVKNSTHPDYNKAISLLKEIL